MSAGMMQLRALRPRQLLGAFPRCATSRARHVSASAQASAQYFATCHPGLEEVVAQELRSPAIGARVVATGKAGVVFTGDQGVLYRSNIWLRAAIRVLQLLAEVDLDAKLPAGESIYDAFRAAEDWAALLGPRQSFSIDVRIYGCTNLSNSQLLVVRARDAICDAIRDRRGTKPMPPPAGQTADVPLFVTAFQDRLSIYRDASGESLHRRGYRQAMHRASLNEAAAAGCLYIAGWPQLCRDSGGEGATLADPMTGSGTFLIEAALMATNTAPGLFRRWWPFMTWHDADRGAWKEAVAEANDAKRSAHAVQLWGNDVHGGALGLAARDAEAASVRHMIRLRQGDCAGWQLPHPPSLVVCNPPWGQRLLAAQQAQQAEEYEGNGRRAGRAGSAREVPAELAEAWAGLGMFLKRQADGAQAFVLSGNTQATQALRLRSGRRIPLTIGGVDCRLLQYEIRGSAGLADGGAPGDAERSRAALMAMHAAHRANDGAAAPRKSFFE